MQQLYVVGAAILKDGRYLVARRSLEMRLPGKWEFPGGKVEDGETREECLRREIREELGIQIEVGDYVATGVVKGDEADIRLDVFRCTWRGGELEAREHDQLRWVAPAEMEELEWAEADWAAVEALGGSVQNSV